VAPQAVGVEERQRIGFESVTVCSLDGTDGATHQNECEDECVTVHRE